MSLVFDNRTAIQNGPGLHALIVGISEYPFLKGGERARPENDKYGFTELSSCAHTAYNLYRWLLDQRDSFSVPLASVRLLLSPSRSEQDDTSEIGKLAVPCTVRDFLLAANEWSADARTRRENMTMFYFAGRGMYRDYTEPIAFLADFGDGIGPLLRGGVSLQNMFRGMAPSSRHPNVARTQLYFLDVAPPDEFQFRDLEYRNVSSVFDIFLPGLDDRIAPLFYADQSHNRAYSRVHRMTFFGEALIDCLNSAAGEFGELESAERWYVSVQSLIRALPQRLLALTGPYNISQGMTISGAGGEDAIIRFLPGPPLVSVIIKFGPQNILPHAKLEIANDNGEVIWSGPSPHDKNLQEPIPLPGGYYKVSVKVDPPQQGVSSQYTRLYSVKPPQSVWIVNVVNR